MIDLIDESEFLKPSDLNNGCLPQLFHIKRRFDIVTVNDIGSFLICVAVPDNEHYYLYPDSVRNKKPFIKTNEIIYKLDYVKYGSYIGAEPL